jgi:hypothetical protein
MTAKRMAHPMAPFRIALAPPRTAREPPVKKPAMMAFQGSSFRRTPLTAQSRDCQKGHAADILCRKNVPNVEKSPPHTPKLPPRTGARALIAVIAILPVNDLPAEASVWSVRTAYSPLAIGTVPETLHTVPNYCTMSDRAFGDGELMGTLYLLRLWPWFIC